MNSFPGFKPQLCSSPPCVIQNQQVNVKVSFVSSVTVCNWIYISKFCGSFNFESSSKIRFRSTPNTTRQWFLPSSHHPTPFAVRCSSYVPVTPVALWRTMGPATRWVERIGRAAPWSKLGDTDGLRSWDLQETLKYDEFSDGFNFWFYGCVPSVWSMFFDDEGFCWVGLMVGWLECVESYADQCIMQGWYHVGIMLMYIWWCWWCCESHWSFVWQLQCNHRGKSSIISTSSEEAVPSQLQVLCMRNHCNAVQALK